MSTGRTRLLALAIVLIVLVGLATLLSSPGDGPSPDPQPSVDPAAVAPPPLRTDTVAEGAPDPAESERRIERPVRITGRVTSVSGEPVPAGVLVHARYDRDMIVIVKTDDAGRFELPEIPSGEIALFVHGGGWVSPGLARFDWDRSSPFVADVEAGEEEPRELLAEPVGSAAVTVLFPDGSPAVGAEHCLAFGKLIDGLMYPVKMDPAAGTFRIDDLVPGIEMPDYPPMPGSDGPLPLPVEDSA